MFYVSRALSPARPVTVGWAVFSIWHFYTWKEKKVPTAEVYETGRDVTAGSSVQYAYTDRYLKNNNNWTFDTYLYI